jgi:polysaccharide export outer membrane protein
VFQRRYPGVLAALLLCSMPCVNGSAAAAPPADVPATAMPAPANPAPDSAPRPLTSLGPGDSVTLHVFGQPVMDSMLTVADDGTISVPLAGPIRVAGLSTDNAARRIEAALKYGGFFVDPHVTLMVTQSLSQRVSVLGEVRTPGRYPVDAKTTIVDLLAQAGGETEVGSETVYVLRPNASGTIDRYPVNLKGLADAATSAPTQTLHAGDSVYVPRAEQFFILGEVQKPSMYKLEPNLTVLQAVALAGGITAKGSTRRVEISRIGKNGEQLKIKPNLSDLVQPNDVIRVKESIF